MARAGLDDGWNCLFANDFDPMKAGVYRANWGDADMHLADINALNAIDLPGHADLAWASFPCQDLSLAGNAAGIGSEADQTRSGAFWAFWRLMQALIEEGRAPSVIVLENVYGALTANGGRDFATIGRCLALGGYRFGAMLIDAVQFVPQSRPRVFVVAIRGDLEIPNSLCTNNRRSHWHPIVMETAIDRLGELDRMNWVWLDPPTPARHTSKLADLLEDEPEDVSWHSPTQTNTLVGMMSEVNRARLEAMRRSGERKVGTIYKRTRVEGGVRRQRAELRDDGVSGCLRTPGGGSSRQTVMIVEGESVRSRLLSAREAARLMGLPDSYRLPPRYNDAYHVAGDGLVVPVVRFLAHTVIEPILAANESTCFLEAAE